MGLNFWWYEAPEYKWPASGVALIVLLVSVGAAAGLYVVSFGRRWPPWGTPPAAA
jgi:hypothetical protein